MPPRILIVDNDEDTLQICALTLTRESDEVLFAKDGHNACGKSCS